MNWVKALENYLMSSTTRLSLQSSSSSCTGRTVFTVLVCLSTLSKLAFAGSTAGLSAQTNNTGTPAEAGIITLEAAIRAATESSPRLKVAESAMRASKGERLQAGMWANPEVSVNIDNVGGKGPYRGFDSAEITYGLSQVIEIGGKRAARMDLAERGVALASIDYVSARLDLIRDVQLAYAEAISAQEQVKITQEQQSLAKEVLGVVSQRVGAAREPVIQKSKAEVTFSSSTIARDKAERALAAAKRVLAALCGGSNETFEVDAAAFFAIADPAQIVGARDAWRKTPDFTRSDIEIAKSRAALNLEEANAVPDPKVSAGIRDFRESENRAYAFVFGVALPLPVLNRNQGGIEKARQEVNRAENTKAAAAMSLGAELTRAQTDLETSYYQAVTLKDSILPVADRAFKQAREGYGSGKFSYLEVLDAQRTLYDVRSEYHNALRDYHRSRAQVERISATYLAPSKHSEEIHE